MIPAYTARGDMGWRSPPVSVPCFLPAQVLRPHGQDPGQGQIFPLVYVPEESNLAVGVAAGFPHDCFSRGLPGLGLSAFTPRGDVFRTRTWTGSPDAGHVPGEQRGEGSRADPTSSRTSSGAAASVAHLTRASSRAQGRSPHILASLAAGPGCGQGPSPPAWGRGEGVVGPFCFLCPFLLVFLLGLGWKMGSLESWMEGGERPLPHAPKGRRAGLSATSRRWGLPPRAPSPPPLQLLA